MELRVKPGEMWAADASAESLHNFHRLMGGIEGIEPLEEADLGSTALRVFIGFPFKYEESTTGRTVYSLDSSWKEPVLTLPGAWKIGAGESVPSSASEAESEQTEEILSETASDVATDAKAVVKVGSYLAVAGAIVAALLVFSRK